MTWWVGNAQPEVHTEGNAKGERVDVDVVGGDIYIEHEVRYDGNVTVNVPFVVMAAFMEAMGQVK